MLKKQIQKLLLTGLLGLILFSIFPIVKTNAADCNLKQYFPGVVQSNKSTVAANESFDLYLKINMDAATFAACKALQPGSIAFSPWPYKDYALPGDYVANVQITYEATEAKDGSGYEALIKDTTLNKLGYDQTALSKFELFVYGYYHFRNDSASKAYYITSGSIRNGGQYAAMKIDNKAATHEPTATLPTINAAKLVGVDGDGNVKDYAKVNLSIKPNTNGTGLRSKYRIKWDDGDLNFGTTGGLEGVHLEWQDDASVMRNGVTQFTLPKKDNGWGYDSNPYFSGAAVYFNYAKAVASLTGANLYCKGTSFGTDCSGIMFREADNNPKGSGHGNLSLPADLKPSLKIAAWQSADSGITAPTAEQKKPNGNQGKPIGTIEFVALPAIIGQKNAHAFVTWEAVKSATVDQTVTLVASNGKLTPFTVEVFGNDEDIKTACKADAGVTDKTKCDDLNFAKYQFAEPVTQTSSSSEAKDPGTTQSLYDFIVRVISQIVIWLTALIYKIFSYFVVPVLNALLQVRPYQDAFVNIIYPGWLILRNLANIFFIVSLLIVGLRILFQSSEASTSRGFIVRLILMALLVNFSLVIGQGVVGIADTVQSQFMPVSTDPVTGEKTNSKIIEALGNKLMVEPILSFRAAVSPDGSGSGQLTGDQTIADTAKPIVLLVLAIAALFSFIAIAAFLAVRLVALMILYMVAPIAYASYVLKDSEQLMSTWWKNFLKYAFLTPVLVFFLNIAALVATVFSGQNGNVIKLSDNLSGDLVAGGLTIATHFIVLLFIYAGMIVAQKSGTIGSKAIIDYSKKGFDWTTKTAPKAIGIFAKDTSSDYLASKTKSPGLQKAIRSIARPIDAGKAFKKGYLDMPKAKMNERFETAFQGLTKSGWKYGEDKALPAKMAWWKLRGQSATDLYAQAREMSDVNGIKDDKERREVLGGIVDSMQDEVDKTKAGIKNLEKERDRKGTSDTDKDRLNKQIANENTALVGQENALNNAKNIIKKADMSGDQIVNINKVEAELNSEFGGDKLDRAVEKAASDLKGDDNLRDKYKVVNDTTLKDRKAEYGALLEKAGNRDWKQSPGSAAEQNAREENAGKAYKDVDDKEALYEAYKGALKNNNTDLAAFIAKKLSKAGLFDGLMEEFLDENGKKYENNVVDLERMLEKQFKHLTRAERSNMAMQISFLNGQNGNSSLANAVVARGAHGRAFKTEAQQQKDSKALFTKKSVTDMGKGDIARKKNGKFISNNGVIDKLNAHSISDEAQKKIKRIEPDKAKFILALDDANKLNDTVRELLREASGKRKI